MGLNYQSLFFEGYTELVKRAGCESIFERNYMCSYELPQNKQTIVCYTGINMKLGMRPNCRRLSFEGCKEVVKRAGCDSIFEQNSVCSYELP